MTEKKSSPWTDPVDEAHSEELRQSRETNERIKGFKESGAEDAVKKLMDALGLNIETVELLGVGKAEEKFRMRNMVSKIYERDVRKRGLDPSQPISMADLLGMNDEHLETMKQVTEKYTADLEGLDEVKFGLNFGTAMLGSSARMLRPHIRKAYIEFLMFMIMHYAELSDTAEGMDENGDQAVPTPGCNCDVCENLRAKEKKH